MRAMKIHGVRLIQAGGSARAIARVVSHGFTDGDTATEAETNARLGAVQRDHGFRNIHVDVGLARWTFVTFPPWKEDDEEATPAPVLSGAGA
jgi:hypothetical protein